MHEARGNICNLAVHAMMQQSIQSVISASHEIMDSVAGSLGHISFSLN